MEKKYGKLILMQEGSPEQEYELGKSSISLGRAMTNDIILNDGRASRNHARLECSPTGCKLIDMGSANGTLVNGLRVSQASLNPGDVLRLGSTQLRFEIMPMEEEVGLTVIDSEADLQASLERDFIPMTLNETGLPRLVIFSGENTWEVSLDDIDQAIIGRIDENQVIIPNTNVSRHHAEVVRKGGIFVLHDLGSTNGTFFRGEKVGEMILQDGDVFHVGPAQVVFKSGFAEASLTMADESFSIRPSRQPVVFVPGSMGSELWLGQERLWPNVKLLLSNPEILKLPSDSPIEPRAIVDEVVVVPNLIKLDQYNRLGDYLVEDLGYQRGVDFFEFPYDWRLDVRDSARKLAAMVESLPVTQPVTIIAHSLGTMVSRYYIERLGGKGRVGRAILMGGPHQGSIKILTSMLTAPQLLPFGIMGERMRQVVVTFPASYQIIPTYACGVDQFKNGINFLDDESWLPAEHVEMLRAGRKFRQEIGKRLSVPSLSIFGYGIKTISSIYLERTPDGKLRNFQYRTENSGDSTILDKSAVMDASEIHPVQQYHGSLFVDNDVKMRLKIELARAI